MDIYIKMCDCPEIQEQRQWEYYDQESKQRREGNFVEGDVYALDGSVMVLGHTPYPPSETKTYGKDQSVVGYDEGAGFRFEKLVWLPTQPQLQEMVHSFTGPYCGNWFIDTTPQLLEDLRNFIFNEKTGYITSMEQLWLAFVMLTLYHKKWYNGEWRVENDKDNTISETAH